MVAGSCHIGGASGWTRLHHVDVNRQVYISPGGVFARPSLRRRSWTLGCHCYRLRPDVSVLASRCRLVAEGTDDGEGQSTGVNREAAKPLSTRPPFQPEDNLKGFPCQGGVPGVVIFTLL